MTSSVAISVLLSELCIVTVWADVLCDISKISVLKAGKKTGFSVFFRRFFSVFFPEIFGKKPEKNRPIFPSCLTLIFIIFLLR